MPNTWLSGSQEVLWQNSFSCSSPKISLYRTSPYTYSARWVPAFIDRTSPSSTKSSISAAMIRFSCVPTDAPAGNGPSGGGVKPAGKGTGKMVAFAL